MSDATRRRTAGVPGNWLPRLFAAFSAALGAGVLIGWALGLEELTRVLPGLVTMKPNAALAFLLAGLALWSIRQGPGGRRHRRQAIGFSLAVAAIGGLTLFEYFTSIDLGIDEFFFHEPANAIGTLHPGRMHPTTALDFLILGLASALLAADREHRAAQVMVLMAAFIAGSTLIGYLFGVREFVGLAMFSQMALHTTLGMLALSAGLLLARQGRGLMISIVVDGPSGLMARRLLLVAVLTPIVITGFAIGAHQAGLFDERFGAAIRVTFIIAIFVTCIWWSSHWLYRVEEERRRAELERLEGERRFQLLTSALPQIVWLAKADGEVDYFNHRWYDYTGQDPELPIDWPPIIHPDDLQRCRDLWGLSTSSGERYHGEFRFRRRDGAYRWFLVWAEPIRDEAGRTLRWVGTCTDIHDQKRAGEQRYRSLVEATSAIVWSTPPCGTFETEQTAWFAFTGQSFDQHRGWGWLQAVHPDDQIETAHTWSTAHASQTNYQMMHRLRRHDGEYRHMVARAVPLLDDDGSVLEWIGVHTDVDVQERAHEAMREAKEAAETATRVKAEFLANMSHEIRTPMNGVLGMTELALATELTPRQREYLGLVKSSADALLTVIDDILDFSKIEAGKLKLDPIPFLLRDMVADTLRCLALKAHQKGLELACRIAPEVPDSVVGDPGRLRQVLVNLVGNAIKFTERGEVVVTVEAHPRADLPSVLRFSVIDSGIGIPAGKRASIFDSFQQADGSTTRKYGGTGLGLTISTRLVELMGGRIAVDANPAGGSVFRFSARFDLDPGVRDHRPSLLGPIVLDGLRILIVDDNRTNRVILEEILSQWGCRPVGVAAASEALTAMERATNRDEPFSLVLLDQTMPEMDGNELVRRIKADPRQADARLLMLTSGGSDDASRSPELGINAWLAKPVRQSELLDAILDQLGPDQEDVRPSRPRAVATDIPTPSRNLRVLLAEDHPINQKVAIRMLEDPGHEVTVVGNGREAVEALASRAFDVVVMDVAMPEMDGFEALAAIRRRERSEGGHLPIVALTAHAMTGDRERCLDAGFDDYLSKPVQAAALAKVLARVVDGFGSPTVPPAEPEPPTSAHLAFDIDSALENLGGDEPLLVEILKMYFEDSPRFLAEVRLAAQAGDAMRLKFLGHSLAGSAGNLAAPEIVSAARTLEAIGGSGDLANLDEAVRDFSRAFDRFRQAVDVSRLARPSPRLKTGPIGRILTN